MPANGQGRLWLLGMCAAVLIVAVALAPPVAEPGGYAGFADERTLFGVANFLNVVSNAPLLLVGAWGVWFLARTGSHAAFAQPFEKVPYLFLFFGVALAALASGYYHLAPDAARLAWDRIPIGLAFMALLSAVIAERISVRAGVRLLGPLLAAGAASVLYWRWSALRGAEDVLPYAAVQYGALLYILLISLLFPSRYTGGGAVFVAAGFYGAAKAAEMLDAQIYALGHVVSGHTLKHLFAALAAWWLLRMLQRRAPL